MLHRTPRGQSIHDSLIDYVLQSGRVAEAMEDFPRHSDRILGELCERFMSNSLACRNIAYTWIKRMFPQNTLVVPLNKKASVPVLDSKVAQTPTCPASRQSLSSSVKHSASPSTFETCMGTVRPDAHSSRVKIIRLKPRRSQQSQLVFHLKKRVNDPVLNGEVAQTPTPPVTRQWFSSSVKDSASPTTFVHCTSSESSELSELSESSESSEILATFPLLRNAVRQQVKHAQTRRILETSVKMQFSLADGERAYWLDEGQAKTAWNEWIGERVKHLACLPCSLHVKSNTYYPWAWEEFITYARCNYPGCGTFTIAKLRGSDSVVVEMRGLMSHPEKKLRKPLWKITNNRGR